MASNILIDKVVYETLWSWGYQAMSDIFSLEETKTITTAPKYILVRYKANYVVCIRR